MHLRKFPPQLKYVTIIALKSIFVNNIHNKRKTPSELGVYNKLSKFCRVRRSCTRVSTQASSDLRPYSFIRSGCGMIPQVATMNQYRAEVAHATEMCCPYKRHEHLFSLVNGAVSAYSLGGLLTRSNYIAFSR